MPLKRDASCGGTDADGAKSLRFCSNCWQDGKFTRPDCTVAQMQDLVRAKMKEMGIPGFLGGWFARRIPRLERWNSPAG